jgi:hypothetical protein
MHKRVPSFIKKYALAFFTAICLFIFLSFTNPQELAIHWFILPAFLAFCFLYFLFGATFSGIFNEKVKQKVLVVSMALFVSILIILQSLGQLTYRDFILSSLFMLVTLFFLRRADYI